MSLQTGGFGVRVNEGLGLGYEFFPFNLSPTPASEPDGLFGILQSSSDLPLAISTIAPSSDLNKDIFVRTPHVPYFAMYNMTHTRD